MVRVSKKRRKKRVLSRFTKSLNHAQKVAVCNVGSEDILDMTKENKRVAPGQIIPIESALHSQRITVYVLYAGIHIYMWTL